MVGRRSMAAAALALASVSVLVLVSSAEAGRDRKCGTSPPVYELATFNNVPCTRADDVSFRLANRFDEAFDFRGDHSTRTIKQRDDKRKKWRCNWQSADVHNNSILWACKRKRGVITWAWRDPSDGVEPDPS